MTDKKDGIYMLAHGFPENTELAKCVKHVIKICKEKNVLGEPSKMGTHLTLLPPFYGDDKTIKFASSIMRVLTSLLGELYITTTCVGYFSPSTEASKVEAMYLKIKLPEMYHEYVEWLKATNPFKWVHPPAQTTAVEPIYIPHVHVIEGVNLFERLKPFEEDLRFVITGRTFELTPPKFFKKDEVTKQWKQVIP